MSEQPIYQYAKTGNSEETWWRIGGGWDGDEPYIASVRDERSARFLTQRLNEHADLEKRLAAAEKWAAELKENGDGFIARLAEVEPRMVEAEKERDELRKKLTEYQEAGQAWMDTREKALKLSALLGMKECNELREKLVASEAQVRAMAVAVTKIVHMTRSVCPNYAGAIDCPCVHCFAIESLTPDLAHLVEEQKAVERMEDIIRENLQDWAGRGSIPPWVVARVNAVVDALAELDALRKEERKP